MDSHLKTQYPIELHVDRLLIVWEWEREREYCLALWTLEYLGWLRFGEFQPFRLLLQGWNQVGFLQNTLWLMKITGFNRKPRNYANSSLVEGMCEK